MAIVVRVLQSLPLIIFLVVLALVIYFVVSWLRSPQRAKEVLIQFFTVFNIILSVFFGLASLYALFEHNDPVLELTASFLVVALLALGITRICRARFVKNNPHYKDKPANTEWR